MPARTPHLSTRRRAAGRQARRAHRRLGRRRELGGLVAGAFLPEIPWTQRSNRAAVAACAVVDVVAASTLLWLYVSRHGAASTPVWLVLAAAAVAAAIGVRAVTAAALAIDALRWRDGAAAAGSLAAVMVVAATAFGAYMTAAPFWQAYQAFPETGGQPAFATPLTSVLPNVAPAVTAAAVPLETLPGAPSHVVFLLIGGDAGEGRSGVRTDSISLLGVNPDTGDAYMIGIPRNIEGAPVPPSLQQRFPNGYRDLINSAYQWGERHAGETPDPNHPGGSVLKGVVAELTGVTVDYYIRIDMAGFVDLVDAVGGVSVENLTAAPLSRLPGDSTAMPAKLEVGVHQLDGRLALAYSRSRKADSDYQRMARQRCVLTGLAGRIAQQDTFTVAQTLATVMVEHARTDIPRDAVLTFAKALTSIDPASLRTLAITPPHFVPSRPDVAKIREAVAAVSSATTPVELAAEPATTAPDTTRPQISETPGVTVGSGGVGDGGGRTVCRPLIGP
jgi:LCP family protein required for cell wall assembly